jgi:hypothetical protein
MRLRIIGKILMIYCERMLYRLLEVLLNGVVGRSVAIGACKMTRPCKMQLALRQLGLWRRLLPAVLRYIRVIKPNNHVASAIAWQEYTHSSH